MICDMSPQLDCGKQEASAGPLHPMLNESLNPRAEYKIEFTTVSLFYFHNGFFRIVVPTDVQ